MGEWAAEFLHNREFLRSKFDLMTGDLTGVFRGFLPSHRHISGQYFKLGHETPSFPIIILLRSMAQATKPVSFSHITFDVLFINRFIIRLCTVRANESVAK
jgi:hypothetical protein